MRSGVNQNRGTRPAPPAHRAPTVAGQPAKIPEIKSLSVDQAGGAAAREAPDITGSLLPILPDAVVGLDAPGRITHWNAAAERIYGIPAIEAIGHRMADLVETVLSDGDLATAREQLHRHGRWRGEVRQISRAGRVVEVESTVAALYDRSGASRGMLAVNRVLPPGVGSDRGDLTHQATHDSLTGLPNRPALLRRLEEALARLGSGRGAGPAGKRLLAVLFCDLDGFKEINDGHGHAVGDQVLVAVAQRLRRGCRHADVVARFGGDEFVVVLAVDTVADATATGNRIIEMLDAPIPIGDDEVSAGVSVGVTVLENPPPGPDPVAAVLRDADTAMYHAKSRGRGRTEFYDADLRENAEERVELATALRRAVGDGEFELVYQTRRTCAGRRVRGVEALVRWRHPELGLLGPQAFLPVAERTGRIVELGEWVLRRSLADLGALTGPGQQNLTLAVNVSARQLTGTRLIESVARALAQTRVAPARLILEVPQTALGQDPPAAREALAGLKALGVRIALDDFGTGGSSLQYLRRLPVDQLKVDRSFVADLAVGTGRDGADAVIASVLSLGHGLGRAVVAEGVEDERTLERLRVLGCDEYQGFLDGEPGVLEEVLSASGRTLGQDSVH